MARITILFIVTSLFVGTLQAQSVSDSRVNQFWAGIGLGPGIFFDLQENENQFEALAGTIYGTYRFNRNLLSGRRADSGEFLGKNVYDYALIYGRVLGNEKPMVSLGGGVGYVDGDRSDLFGDPEPIDNTLGFAIELQVRFRLFNFLGIGLYGFGNINKEIIFGGVTIGVQLGKLR